MTQVIAFLVFWPFEVLTFLFLLFIPPRKLYSAKQMEHFIHDGYVHGEFWPYKFSLEGKLLTLWADYV